MSADSQRFDPVNPTSYWLELRKRVLTPPIMGCLAGIVVGAVPPLRALLLPTAGSTTGLFPLPLFGCLEAFGRAYSPAALLVLASSLALPSVPKPAEGTESIALSTPTVSASGRSRDHITRLWRGLCSSSKPASAAAYVPR